MNKAQAIPEEGKSSETTPAEQADKLKKQQQMEGEISCLKDKIKNAQN